MGTLDDYAYQKRMEKSAKKQKADPKPKSSGSGGASRSGGSGAGWSGGSYAAAARARDVQAQQEAARQRAMEEAYKRQQEAAKKAKAEAAQKKLDEANAAEAAKREKDRQFDPEKKTTYSGVSFDPPVSWMDDKGMVHYGPKTVNEAAATGGDTGGPGAATQEARNIQSDQWANRISYLTDAQLKASSSDPGKITDAKQIDFDKMNVSDKGALMWNSMLDTALAGDKRGMKEFGVDANKDGLLQLSELRKGASVPKGYKAAYRSAFGDVDEKDIAFSPKVVGLLNTYGVDNVGLSLKQLREGSGYITDEDLVGNQKFRKAGGDTGPASHIDSRNEILVERLRPQLDEFTDMARNAEAKVGGAPVGIDLFGTSQEQRNAFVDATAMQLAQTEETLRQLRLSGQGKYTNDRFGDDGMDLSMLGSQKQLGKVNMMQQLRASIESAGGTLDLGGADKAQKLKYLSQYGITGDEWTGFLKNVRKSESEDKDKRTADELLGLKKEEEGAK